MRYSHNSRTAIHAGETATLRLGDKKPLVYLLAQLAQQNLGLGGQGVGAVDIAGIQGFLRLLDELANLVRRLLFLSVETATQASEPFLVSVIESCVSRRRSEESPPDGPPEESTPMAGTSTLSAAGGGVAVSGCVLSATSGAGLVGGLLCRTAGLAASSTIASVSVSSGSKGRLKADSARTGCSTGGLGTVLTGGANCCTCG